MADSNLSLEPGCCVRHLGYPALVFDEIDTIPQRCYAE
jgi:hypothetical protein